MAEYKIPNHLQKFGVDITASDLTYHRRRVEVSKEFSFDAAHHLHQYDGKCKNLHGHTYRLIITISGFVDDTGLVIDFADIKKMYQERIESHVDHQYLNEVLPAMNTSAENMIVWMWEQLQEALSALSFGDRQLRLEELSLYETPTSRATLKRAWME